MFTEHNDAETCAGCVYKMAALLSGFLSEVSLSSRTERESSALSPHMTGKEANEGATTAGVTGNLAV